MPTIFVWELWQGQLWPSKRCVPLVGSVALFEQRARASHPLTDADATLPLDVLAKIFPAPEVADD